MINIGIPDLIDTGGIYCRRLKFREPHFIVVTVISTR